jgi:hypothetical protein
MTFLMTIVVRLLIIQTRLMILNSSNPNIPIDAWIQDMEIYVARLNDWESSREVDKEGE